MENMTIEEMNREANDLLDADVDATRRMRNVVTQDINTANKTLEILDDQGQQLKRVEDNLHGINAHAKRAEADLTKMEKCCGCFHLPCAKRHNFEGSTARYGQVWGGNTAGHASNDVVSEQPRSARGQSKDAKSSAGGNQQFIQPILENDERESEMNDNMKIVSGGISILRQQAMAMGEELEEQNETLDRMGDKTDLNIKRVQNASARTAALL
eukprot:gene2932-5737_t